MFAVITMQVLFNDDYELQEALDALESMGYTPNVEIDGEEDED